MLGFCKETRGDLGTAVPAAAGDASALDLAQTIRDVTAWEVASTVPVLF